MLFGSNVNSSKYLDSRKHNFKIRKKSDFFAKQKINESFSHGNCRENWMKEENLDKRINC